MAHRYRLAVRAFSQISIDDWLVLYQFIRIR